MKSASKSLSVPMGSSAVRPAPRKRMTALKNRTFYLLALPAFLILLAMNIFPLIYSLGVSLTNYSLANPDRWRFIGLENYSHAVQDPMVLNAFLNTAKFTVGAVIIEFLLGFGVALLLNRLTRFGNLILALLMPPMMLTPVIVGLQWRFLFNFNTGLVNYLLEGVGVGRFPFLAKDTWALLAIIFADVWQWTPYVILLIYSGLKSLPSEPYEAAAIDGASEVQMFRFITLPYLRNTMVIVLLIRGMDALREYDKIFTMTYGGPGSATETATFNIYLRAFKFFETGYASAVSYILLILTLVIIQWAMPKLRQSKT